MLFIENNIIMGIINRNRNVIFLPLWINVL
jgi:hypothetical protein